MRPRKRYGNQRNVQTNSSRRSGIRFLGEVSQTKSNHCEHIQEDKQAGGRSTRHGMSRHHHCSSLHFLSISPPDAGKYTVPPQVCKLGNRLQATAGKRSRCPLNRSGPLKPRKHSSLVSEIIQTRRNASLDGRSD